MKNIIKLLSFVLLLCMIIGSTVACNNNAGNTGGTGTQESGTVTEESSETQAEASTTDGDESVSVSETTTADIEETTTVDEETTTGGEDTTPEFVDYVSQLKLDMNSNTVKQKVTVKTFVDGDTTHFNVPTSFVPSGVLKARYLAINTPESTGKIEEWGKKASNFTREKLESATSIIIESDNETWNLDSTGGRYLVWIWYKTSESEEYRNLNLEILQNGLAIASNAGGNRYGTTCLAALSQAKNFKLYVFSGQKDPDMYYGEAVELTLKELRCNIKDYNGIKVAFDGVITVNSNNSIYLEDYDPDTGLYFGMTVYLGFGLPGEALSILTVGNRARIVGTVQYYEAGDTYQISGLVYRVMRPDDPNNVQKLGEGFSAAYPVIDADMLLNGKVQIQSEDEDEETVEYAYGELALNSTVCLENLKVQRIYTTDNEASSSNGAMTITCLAPDGTTITVRTEVFYDDDRNLITADAYEGKTITVKGLVDHYNGAYQVRVVTPDNIIIIE